MTGCEVIEFTCSFDDLIYPGITKFDHISGLHIYKVIMLHTVVCFFKLRNISAELMLNNQAAIQQELNGVVKRGAANTVILVLHKDIERFDIKMTIP